MDPRGDGFPRFPDLPCELRCHIWKELIPAHGIYLVGCDPVLDDSNNDHDGPRTLRLALGPAHHEFKNPGLAQRIRAQKILLATCGESRAELCRRFPDTLDGGGPRFSFRHDLIYIVPSSFLVDFIRPVPPPNVRLEFVGGWNKLVHRLALNGKWCQAWSNFLRLSNPVNARKPRHRMHIGRFMGFLTTCTSLQELVLTRPCGVSFDAWAMLPRKGQATVAGSMLDGYGGLTCEQSEELDMLGVRLDGAVSLLRGIILDDLEGIVHGDLMDTIETGYPALKDLEISQMVHFTHHLRWVCLGP